MNTETATKTRFTITPTGYGAFIARDLSNGSSLSNVTTEEAHRWIAVKSANDRP